ncbi:hypothetical protein O6H91_Y333700 [Diphasiastrum complanatum]|nr:hypothetical protein O6H91_Y333700 [Diphasiastrum complanatum]
MKKRVSKRLSMMAMVAGSFSLPLLPSPLSLIHHHHPSPFFSFSTRIRELPQVALFLPLLIPFHSRLFYLPYVFLFHVVASSMLLLVCSAIAVPQVPLDILLPSTKPCIFTSN